MQMVILSLFLICLGLSYTILLAFSALVRSNDRYLIAEATILLERSRDRLLYPSERRVKDAEINDWIKRAKGA